MPDPTTEEEALNLLLAALEYLAKAVDTPDPPTMEQRAFARGILKKLST